MFLLLPIVFFQSHVHVRGPDPMHAARKNFERAVGRPRPEPGLLTPGSRPPPRTALVCSLPEPAALNSRVLLRIPIGSVDVGTARCARHRHALRTRVSAPQARAQCLLACLASSCSAISATAVQPSSAAHCGIGRRETLRASTQIAYTRAHCLLDCCHWVASRCTSPPVHLPLPLVSPKTKTPRSLGDMMMD